MSISLRPSFKKATLFALIISAPTCAMAYNTLFNGYYGGVMGGIMQTDTQISADSSAEFNTFFSTDKTIAMAQRNVNVFKYTGTGAIYLGYGHFIPNSCFYLAGEIFGNWAARNNALRNAAYQANLGGSIFEQYYVSLTGLTSSKLRRSEFGIDIRPGFMMDTNTLLYGRIGLAFNKLTTTNTNDFAFTGLAPLLPALTTSHSYLNQSKTKNKTALRLGLGLEYHVADNLSVTADYIYTYYGKVNTSAVGDTTFNNGEDFDTFITNFVEDGAVAHSSTRMYTQTAMLGLKYYFYPTC
jgi:opacity protein-like surface antigen